MGVPALTLAARNSSFSPATRASAAATDRRARGCSGAVPKRGVPFRYGQHVSAVCQRSSNNPHPWSLKIPRPPDRGGRVHERDIVKRTGAGGQRHWPRGHTTRGGAHGPRGRLAGSAPAVPRRAAIEGGDRPTVGAGSED